MAPGTAFDIIVIAGAFWLTKKPSEAQLALAN